MVTIVSHNGLSPGQHQAIILTNAGILLIWTFETNLQWNSYIFIQENAFENIICEMAAYNIICEMASYNWVSLYRIDFSPKYSQ